MKKIKYLDLFSGIGAFPKAMENLNIDFDTVGFCEIDKFAIKSYCAIHNESPDKNLGDITKVNPHDLSDIDLVTFGSPCFQKDTIIMTNKGFKRIAEIEEGDMVLTHTNTFKKVIRTMEKYSQDIYKINIFGVHELLATKEHPFYVRKKRFSQDNSNIANTRIFGEPEWVIAKDLNIEDFVGIAINQNSKLPDWNGNELSKLFTKREFWWLVGRYIGNGWTNIDNIEKHLNSPIYSTSISCDKDEVSEITNKIKNIFNYNIDKEDSTYKINIPNKELTLFLMQFGKCAQDKHLNDLIFDLPINFLKDFIDGYLSSGGYFANDKNKIITMSELLAYGIQSCIHKVYKTPCIVYKYEQPKKCIKYREANKKDTYRIIFDKNIKKEQHGFYENGYLWVPFKTKKLIDFNDFVFNFEVEEDNSYTVFNLIVHNCQDFSVAGNQAGAMWTCLDCNHKYNPLEANYKTRHQCPKCNSEKLEKTRSSLIAEGLRIIEAKKPKYVIYENVKNLVNKQFKPTFDLFIKELEDYGYTVWNSVLNSKNYGIPQNRERIFVVGIYNGNEDDFTFPEGFESKLRLKDMLETKVDEKYYMDNKRCEKLLKDLREKIEPSQNNIIQITNPSFSQQRVYSPEGNAPTIAAGNSGGGKEPCKILVENNKDTNQIIKVLDIPKEIINDNERQRRVYSPDGISPTILARHDNAKILTVGMLDMKASNQIRQVYDINGISPTLDTMQGGHRQPKIVVYDKKEKSENKESIIIDDTYGYDGIRRYCDYCPTIRASRQGLKVLEQIKIDCIGNVNPSGKGMNGNVFSSEGLSPTLTTNKGEGIKIVDYERTPLKFLNRNGKNVDGNYAFCIDTSNTGGIKELYNDGRYRIRKLTPLEALILMGFSEEDYNRCRDVNMSDSQLYKQAGNSIVVDVIMYIMKNMFDIE